VCVPPISGENLSKFLLNGALGTKQDFAHASWHWGDWQYKSNQDTELLRGNRGPLVGCREFALLK
jgi:hypothetical protein